MRMRPHLPALAGAATILAIAIAPALAERHPEHMITLGWQTEHADVVAVARPGPTTIDVESGTTTAAFSIESSIRGDVPAGATISVTHRDLGHGPVWTENADHLVFLTRRLATNGSVVYESLSGAFGFRPVVTGEPSERFPRIVSEIAAALSDPAALRPLLVRLVQDTDDGIASNAALDLARHTELRPGLTAADRTAVLRSFRTRRPGRARRQIALAVAATRPEGAAVALVDAVLEPDSDRDRTGIAEALRVLGDATAEARALERLEAADPNQKRSLLAVLRAIGGRASVDPVRALVAAPEPEVRTDAAHTLGEVARSVHRRSPEASVAGRVELTGLLEAAASRNERRAALWALAQLDNAAAYDVLRGLTADKDQDKDTRTYAARLLAQPRVSLVLD